MVMGDQFVDMQFANNNNNNNNKNLKQMAGTLVMAGQDKF